MHMHEKITCYILYYNEYKLWFLTFKITDDVNFI